MDREAVVLGVVNSEETPLVQHEITTVSEKPPTQPSKQRIVSLDTFRGITIWFMMLVNHADGGWAVLNHSFWNGVTIADFVMPFFLFIVGASIALSMCKMVERNTDTKFSLVKKVTWRALKLFLLGIFLQGGDFPFYNIKMLRIMGVLQRISIVYFIVAMTMIFAPKIYRIDELAIPEEATTKYKVKRLFMSHDGIFSIFIKYIATWVIAFVIAVVSIILTFAIPVPNCGTEKVTLRGWLSPDCNAAGYLDELILTPNHMYQSPTCLNASPPCRYFDPEGLLTTLNAVLSGFIGLYFGYTFTQFTTHKQRIFHWIPISVVLVVVSIIMHFCGYPYNKNLYTYSYIFLMAGCSGLLLTLCYVLIDVPKTRVSQILMMPFIVLGMNSIAIYAIDEFVPLIFGSPSGGAMFYWKSSDQNLISWLYKTFLLAFPVPWAVFFYAIFDTLVMIVIAAIFYKQKKFFKI